MAYNVILQYSHILYYFSSEHTPEEKNVHISRMPPCNMQASVSHLNSSLHLHKTFFLQYLHFLCKMNERHNFLHKAKRIFNEMSQSN